MQTYYVASHGVDSTGEHQTYGHAWVVDRLASHGETQLALSNNQEHSTPFSSKTGETLSA
jgi:hypothetical protein|tara:strand:- start:774 stop:953 length:180 start_codon:yes stop_codon:yes gene_type:complete